MFQKNRLNSFVYILWAFVLTLLFFSCSVPFIPEVPPSSYSQEAAINVLSNKYYLIDSGYIEGFGDIYLGEGRYAIFDGIDGIFMVFKYDDEEHAKESWNKITKKYNNPLKLKYFKVNMGDYGIFTLRLENTDLYVWYKDNWLIVISGDKIDNFVKDVNEIYKTIKAR
ncbi:DUF3242 domain-containing protein [Fervidobacterium sp. 2310opik-2]|uniref:DUF3242 domain-containing protein n=1 Tax=Fervidobacterium sp. 2310opik-2 TaxID=1755815 RepID=UPI0013DFB3EA|nr:DUF3242 domain-containing protein [Fervidobacterium sp. 2310opik-2]KAF2961116.1 hypothetical protein AS161_02800 [Fervidobacterium sp. 2310opik-2]